MNEWLKVMLEELERKRAEARDARDEQARRAQADGGSGRGDAADGTGRSDGTIDDSPSRR